MSERGLILLALNLPVGGRDLASMKASPDMTRCPFVAFGSMEIGEQFVAGRQLQGHVLLLRLNELSTPEAERLEQSHILLFLSPGEVAKYLADPQEFAYTAELLNLEGARTAVETGRRPGDEL